MATVKTIDQINARLQRGEAIVLTAMEFKDRVRKGHHWRVDEVDVVTTATRAIMSGTSSAVVMPLEGLRQGEALERLWLNGVPCTPGAPDDAVDLVDVLINGTAESRDHHGRYGGGHLMRDLIEGKTIEIEAKTSSGRSIYGQVTIDDMPFARLYATRNVYQNYSAFTNARNEKSYLGMPQSIFSSRPMPRLKSITTSGSGELTPLANDPDGDVIRSGTKVLVNGMPGTIIGWGTRSHPGGRNLSLAADMKGMDPQYMGGARTSHGVEVTNGIAVPIPVLDQRVLDNLVQTLDETLPMKIADISDRVPLAEATFGDVWDGASLKVQFRPERCIVCSFQCAAEYYCPMQAISWREKTIYQDLCIACGACTANCPGGAFTGENRPPLGAIGSVPAFETNLPISFRMTYGNNGRAVQWRQPLADPRDASLPALDIWFDIMDRCKLEMPSFASRRKDELARAVADEILAGNDLTSGIRVSDLMPMENPPGGILWPSIDAKDNHFEDDRFGRGDVRGKNILFRRHRGYGKSAHRFPVGQALIDVSDACHRSLESYAASELTSCDGELKLIVTVGVDFIPGWSGGRPTPGLAASWPVVRIHPETGLHHEVITGSIVTVFNENGRFVGRAELSLTVDRDVVWCIETPGHDARRTVAFELFEVPPNGEPRRPFAFVKLCAQSPRREDADAMMLGRQVD